MLPAWQIRKNEETGQKTASQMACRNWALFILLDRLPSRPGGGRDGPEKRTIRPNPAESSGVDGLRSADIDRERVLLLFVASGQTGAGARSRRQLRPMLIPPGSVASRPGSDEICHRQLTRLPLSLLLQRDQTMLQEDSRLLRELSEKLQNTARAYVDPSVGKQPQVCRRARLLIARAR